MKLEYIVKQEDENKKLVDILKNKLKISSRMLTKLKKCDNAILLNGENMFVNNLVRCNDKIEIYLDKTYALEEYKINKYQYDEFIFDMDIVYEDEYFICINKPSGMAIHPCCNHRGNTLSDAVYTYFKTKYGDDFSMNLVNRLDRETSGLVIFAKHPYIQELISKQMQQNNVIKKYIALVDGIVKEEHAIIEKNIARKKDSIIERCIDENGDYAKTEYNVIRRDIDKNYTVLELRIYTGRTHQIRVHLSYIGHSLLR